VLYFRGEGRIGGVRARKAKKASVLPERDDRSLPGENVEPERKMSAAVSRRG